MKNMNTKTTPILVTGATGYIASWVIKSLLEQGHTVHATVRDLNKKKSFAHLEKIANQSSGSLQLFQANLLEPGSFDQAMHGCEVVLHMASPFVVTNYKDAVKDIIEPAVLGTENVLNSVNKTESVKRVVVTSSIASTYGDAIDIRQTANNEFDESHWNTTSSETHQPYPYSKVMAERKAWDMQKAQTRWDLVCINPALVLGPSLTPSTQSGSVEVLQQFANGMTLAGVPPMWNGIVDVRDVADAHLQAAFNPKAENRYIISGGTLSLLEMGKILRQRFGNKFPFPRNQLPKAAFKLLGPFIGFSKSFVELNMGYPIYFNADKSKKELGIHYRNIETSLVEHFQQLLDDGVVKKYIP
ncbi:MULTISPECIES: aldehyde reductase [Acinetobacter]|uniref:Aldehyde reductase n=1 Tax=Acinetobacter entericus TaxID=2989714 RepID=A0ABT3NK58_9GAMM|nr:MULTISPECIES: aldehyde reductase [Acinetobacter]MCW8039925.1 aldehyde reductase [Acinetobacter entericus]QXW27492.1 aldehyde reductase [Acinetobacter johnsonii]